LESQAEPRYATTVSIAQRGGRDALAPIEAAPWPPRAGTGACPYIALPDWNYRGEVCGGSATPKPGCLPSTFMPSPRAQGPW
jgi:hypothetical protein